MAHKLLPVRTWNIISIYSEAFASKLLENLQEIDSSGQDA